MLRCEQCGFENRDTDRFCAQCGAPLRREQEQEQEREQTGEPGQDEGERAAPAETPSAEPESRTFMPPPVTPSFSSTPPPPREEQPDAPVVEKTDFDFSRQPNEDDATNPEWRMSSLGPPPTRKRRLWLWIVLGLIIACIVICCAALAFFSFTGTGEELLNDWSTQISEQATEQAS